MRKSTRTAGRRTMATATAVCLLVGFGACAKKPTEPSQPTTTTVTISAAGVSPKSVQVTPGSRVLFINNDNRSHYFHSDPHPDATDCPELNQVGVLAVGQQRETGNLVSPVTCGYHDHDTPSNAIFKGTIVVK